MGRGRNDSYSTPAEMVTRQTIYVFRGLVTGFTYIFQASPLPFSYNKDCPLSGKRLAIELDKLSEVK